jgi:(S)-ureidoglycine aminohydrolase
MTSGALPPGFTRSRVERDHALVAPESHVEAPQPGWRGGAGVTLISPAMGAAFHQYLVLAGTGSESAGAPAGVERFVYVLDGECQLLGGKAPTTLGPDGYAWLPPASGHGVRAAAGARLLLFEKRYRPAPDLEVPGAVIGVAADVEAVAFLGDPDARLRTLLPADPAFDLAINLFTYAPGATLPFVEVHVMEHGLWMLEGAGIYRLAERWYPVQAGDALWIGPYCPQWFAAVGKGPASYLYYKDVNRDPLEP